MEFQTNDLCINNLAEQIAKFQLQEEKLRHIFLQEKLSDLFCSISRGIENFSEDDFLTGLRKCGLSPDDFPYDENTCSYEIKMPNHTFRLFCTEFITFFHQNAYHISVDSNKDENTNITSCPANAVLNALNKADNLFPQWEKQWPEIYMQASKRAKEFNVATKSIDAIVRSATHKKNGEFSIEHHMGKSEIMLGKQVLHISHNDFFKNQARVIVEINNFAESCLPANTI